MKNRLLTNISLLVLFISVAAGGTIPEQRPSSPGKLEINLEDSRVSWTGTKPTGEHHGYVKISNGELVLENNEIRSGSFNLDMNSISNTDLTDETSRAKLIKHLKSDDFFAAEKYPTARFVITKVTRLPVSRQSTGDIKATHKIEGDLTIKDITRRIEFDASVNILKGRLTATSLPFIINRTKWGVNYQSKSITAGLKDQFILDEISLKVDLVTM